MKYILHICPVLLLSLILFSCSDEPSTITVEGKAKIKVPVDYVELRVGLNAQGSNLTELEQSSYQTMLKLKKLLLSEWQFPDSLVQTNRSSIAERFNNNSKDAFYRFNQSMTVTLDSLELYDTLRRDLIAAGATEFRINTFGTFKNAESKQRALKKAYQNAREKAKMLAQNADFTIGRPQKISSSGQFNIPEGEFDVKLRGSSTISFSSELPLESTLIKKFINVDANVDVIFTLE